jgi:streptomycin 6-kinase
VEFNATAAEVPADVARAARARWPERALAWCDAAAVELAELCSRYDARPVQVMQARFGFVVAVTTSEGRELVMRSSADPASPFQARAVGILAELGIGPQLHEIVDTTAGTWTVMDRVRPGTPATEVGPDEFAELLHPLSDGRLVADYLPRLSDWLRQRLTHGAPGDLAPDARQIPPAEREQALELLDELTADEARTFCHGDMSPANILRNHERLMLIDPRGVCGDPEYDLAVVSLKTACDLTLLVRRSRLDVARADAWTRVATAAGV